MKTFGFFLVALAWWFAASTSVLLTLAQLPHCQRLDDAELRTTCVQHRVQPSHQLREPATPTVVKPAPRS